MKAEVTMSMRKTTDPQAKTGVRAKRLDRLASKLEKALQDEKRLRERIDRLREEGARVSQLFQASVKQKPSGFERRKRSRS